MVMFWSCLDLASPGSGFGDDCWYCDRHTSRIQNSERKNSKTTVVESSLLRPLVFNFRWYHCLGTGVSRRICYPSFSMPFLQH
ncbi:hypothetical protein P8452_47229 [Trifolium repens]|nr:hypothetical protein P8452_47229 [Trifolium repens]